MLAGLQTLLERPRSQSLAILEEPGVWEAIAQAIHGVSRFLIGREKLIWRGAAEHFCFFSVRCAQGPVIPASRPRQAVFKFRAVLQPYRVGTAPGDRHAEKLYTLRVVDQRWLTT